MAPVSDPGVTLGMFEENTVTLKRHACAGGVVCVIFVHVEALRGKAKNEYNITITMFYAQTLFPFHR